MIAKPLNPSPETLRIYVLRGNLKATPLADGGKIFTIRISLKICLTYLYLIGFSWAFTQPNLAF